jgi:hypothetical protein
VIESIRQLEELQARVARGDAAADRELRQRLQPAMACTIRRALRFPDERSPLQAAVHAEIRRLGLTARSALLAEDRQIVRLIAGRICSGLFDRIRPPSARLPAEETVSDWARLSCTV